jgi:hypothetical protein
MLYMEILILLKTVQNHFRALCEHNEDFLKVQNGTYRNH